LSVLRLHPGMSVSILRLVVPCSTPLLRPLLSICRLCVVLHLRCVLLRLLRRSELSCN